MAAEQKKPDGLFIYCTLTGITNNGVTTMANNYWIKLYHEIIHDPKMGRLPDNVWRRCIELFLMAGERNDGGRLPPVEDMAWELRVDLTEFMDELSQLQVVNILTKDSDGWYVTKFTDRQAKIDDAERMKAYRERKRLAEAAGNEYPKQPENEEVTEEKRECYDGVTSRNTDTDTDIDKDKETDSAAQPPAPAKNTKLPKMPEPIPAYKVFVEVTGKSCLTKPQIKAIGDLVGTSPQNLDKWRAVVSAWGLRGYRPTNVSGMIDWFKDGIPSQNGKAQENGNKRISETIELNSPILDYLSKGGIRY